MTFDRASVAWEGAPCSPAAEAQKLRGMLDGAFMDWALVIERQALAAAAAAHP